MDGPQGLCARRRRIAQPLHIAVATRLDLSPPHAQDFAREHGQVLYTAVRQDERSGKGVGVVEFGRLDDLKDAMRKLDGAKLKGARRLLDPCSLLAGIARAPHMPTYARGLPQARLCTWRSSTRTTPSTQGGARRTPTARLQRPPSSAPRARLDRNRTTTSLERRPQRHRAAAAVGTMESAVARARAPGLLCGGIAATTIAARCSRRVTPSRE